MKSKYILLILIISLAIFLRFQSIWYIEFKTDEAVKSFLVIDLICKKIFPLVCGRTWTGIYHPPMFVYLLTIPFLFSKNPVIASGYIAILNVLAICLCFLFCKEFFNKRVALIASAFFAVNPWVILYCRKIWAQDLLFFFVMSFFYSLYKAAIKKQNRYVVMAFISLAIVTQLHLSSVCYLILLFVVLVISRPKIKPLYYIFGLGAFFFLYTPYLLYDIKNNFDNLAAFSQLSKLPFVIRQESFIIPFKLATTIGFYSPFNFSIFSVIQVALIIGAIFFLIFHFRENKYCILLLWFIIPLFFLSVSKIPLFYHYFIFLFPVQFIMIGVFADKAISTVKKKNTILGHMASGLVLVLISAQLICSFEFNSILRKTSNILWQGYGPPFKYRVEEITQVMERGYTKPKDVHQEIIRDKSGWALFKYDFMATKYIVENIDAISR